MRQLSLKRDEVTYRYHLGRWDRIRLGPDLPSKPRYNLLFYQSHALQGYWVCWVGRGQEN